MLIKNRVIDYYISNLKGKEVLVTRMYMGHILFCFQLFYLSKECHYFYVIQDKGDKADESIYVFVFNLQLTFNCNALVKTHC